MTKTQAEALKPGDTIVEKATGDEFRFVKLVEVSTIIPHKGGYKFINPRKEIAAQLIPGFEYSRKCFTNGPYFYFNHKKMTKKE